MERVLRKKFIIISVSVVFVVLFCIALVINISNFQEINKWANNIIELLAENDGEFSHNSERLPNQLPQETPYSTRYFTVKMDQSGNIINVDTRNIHLVTEEDAIAYTEEILDKNSTNGYLQLYKYKIIEKEYGKLVIYIDCAQEIILFRSFVVSSVLICTVALLGVFILILILSKKVVMPIVDSYRKQQQFITNISHELKTPLSIIKTNTEVIEVENGTSQWSQSIHNQIGKMNDLVNYLVMLSKMDEEGQKNLKTDFSISDAVVESVDSFFAMVTNDEKKILTKTEPGITYLGDEQSIRLLISILIENAIKYSNDKSTIMVSLYRYKGKIRITVTNMAENLKPGNYNILFERFYRMDSSRNSKTGGFGIGLAMAKTIVRNHNGEIKAESKDGEHIVFKIDL